MQQAEIGSKEWKIEAALSSLHHQSEHGGESDPSQNTEKSNGPFWPRQNWNDFCIRTRNMLLQNGLAEKEIEEEIAKATKNVRFLD